MIGGITSADVKKLRNAGIVTYAQVVEMSDRQFEALTEAGQKSEKHTVAGSKPRCWPRSPH